MTNISHTMRRAEQKENQSPPHRYSLRRIPDSPANPPGVQEKVEALQDGVFQPILKRGPLAEVEHKALKDQYRSGVRTLGSQGEAERRKKVVEAAVAKISQLERTVAQLKKQIRQVKEDHKDTKTELEEAKGGYLDVRGELDEAEELVERLKRDFDRYRRWWVNEYYFVKVLLGMVPDPRAVETIASASHARYKVYKEEVA
ncbi:hypothetical protein DFP72DRAFT_841974 [Ephemerocybe angulata]|uniref:Uncharacterized protein n=1 Tax=Ephemerocybe angulata TaxID=980116 RepID=A0A8H6MC24_9AGAR|nr:hypothetical protein DFP72DRAFT_841974 [Tulosesus angulatus]